MGPWGHGGTLGTWGTLETQWDAGDMEDPADMVHLWGHGGLRGP